MAFFFVLYLYVTLLAVYHLDDICQNTIVTGAPIRQLITYGNYCPENLHPKK